MAIQHWQNYCHTCKRPTLHVRNGYDVPHTGHLVFFCFLALAAIVTPGDLSLLVGVAAIGWLGVWLIHSIANGISAGPPYVCNSCGSQAATPAQLAEFNEQQRLQAATAKGAAIKGKAGVS